MTTAAELAKDLDMDFIQIDDQMDKDSFTYRIYTMMDAFTKSAKSVLIEGESGFGKTAFFKKYAKDRGRPLIIFNVANRPSEDLVGHPRAVEITDPKTNEVIVVTKYTMTEWFYKVLTEMPDAIILFDEFKNADPGNQAGLLNFLQDREIDGHKLPKTSSVFALCNTTEVSANGWDLSAPAANRFCHIKWNFPSMEMISSLQINFGEPMTERESKIRADFTAYLSQNTDQLHKMPTDKNDVAYGWPSPRSWDNAMNVIATVPEGNDSIELEILTGFVGKAVASSYHTWVQLTHIPDVQAIIANGEEYPWGDPAAEDRKVILRFIHSAFALVRTDKKHWHRFVDFLVECSENGFGAQAASVIHQTLKSSVRPEDAKFPVNLVTAYKEVFDRIGMKRS